MYADLWEAIKKAQENPNPEKRFVDIAAHPSLHTKIIRAVQNRKLRDHGFKFLEADALKGNCFLVGESTGSKIRFTLKRSIGAGDL